jgi:Zn-finger nucleic acid-binding protein
MTERQGVEIDYCPQCRGVWLDRGELDKIIDRSAAEPRTGEREEQRAAFREYEAREYHKDPQHRQDPRYRKKKSFLGELFDFD